MEQVFNGEVCQTARVSPIVLNLHIHMISAHDLLLFFPLIQAVIHRVRSELGVGIFNV